MEYTCENKYPNLHVGDEIELISMEGEVQMKPGLRGVIDFFDAIQVHVKWNNGSSLALIPEIDKFVKINSN